MVDQAPDVKHAITDVSKHEICSCCEDVKKCKTELLDSDCEGKFLKAECCGHQPNPVYSSVKEDRSDSDMVPETTCVDMSVGSSDTNQLITEPKTADLKQFRCTECQFSCKRKTTLISRVKQVHSEERPFSCSKCQSSFKFKIALSKRVHSDERPFSCPRCQYSCKVKGDLTRHINVVHSDKRPFSCSQCQHSCKAKSNLIRHMKQVHS